MTSSKKLGVAFWATVVVVVAVVGYPLSFGPYMGLVYRNMMPDSVGLFGERFYFPFGYLLQDGPAPMHEAINWYVCLWLP